jgi:hypothetical protein
MHPPGPENKSRINHANCIQIVGTMDKLYYNQRHSVNSDQAHPAQARSNSDEVLREAIIYACVSDFYDY